MEKGQEKERGERVAEAKQSRTVGLNAERLLQLWLGNERETVFRSTGRASQRHGDHFTRCLEKWSSRLGQALTGESYNRSGRQAGGKTAALCIR